MYHTGSPRPRDFVSRLLSNRSLGYSATVAKQLIAPWRCYLLIDSEIRNFECYSKVVTCIIWCFLSFRVGLSRSLCRRSRFLIITMSSRLQSTFWPLDRCARLVLRHFSSSLCPMLRLLQIGDQFAGFPRLGRKYRIFDQTWGQDGWILAKWFFCISR